LNCANVLPLPHIIVSGCSPSRWSSQACERESMASDATCSLTASLQSPRIIYPTYLQFGFYTPGSQFACSSFWQSSSELPNSWIMPAPTIIDDPEKGTMQIVSPDAVAIGLPKAPPMSHINSAQFKVNETTLDQIKSQLISASQLQKPPPKKVERKVSRAIRFSLWFNTYRFVHPSYPIPKTFWWTGWCSKFFVFTVTINLIGLILAATNVWTYPRHYTGGFLLGNLLVAILVRNELFGRLLYLIINTLFAKVRFCFWP